jgi:FkbM family methyltransferase
MTMRNRVQEVRAAGPAFSAALLQNRLSPRLNRWHLSGLDQLGRRLVLSLLGDPVVFNADDLRMQGPVSSRVMLAHMKADTYEPMSLELFKAALSPGMTVLDIGANIGFYSLIACRAVGDAGMVYAFEADPRNVAHLDVNAKANSCMNLTVITSAVAAGPGTMTFRMAERSDFSSLFASMEEDMPFVTRTVETVAVDDVLKTGQHVDVIKMDIEGGEAAALRGMTATLGASRDLTLFVEFEPSALEAAGESPEDFLDQLKALFKDIRIVNEREHRLIPLSNATFRPTQNLICRLRSD